MLLFTRPQLTLIATLGSVALLGGAFAFQHVGGLAPCALCLWQRWPHAAAILIGAAALATGWRGCDQIAWQLGGISMAGWNVILSLGLAAVWVLSALRRD